MVKVIEAALLYSTMYLVVAGPLLLVLFLVRWFFRNVEVKQPWRKVAYALAALALFTPVPAPPGIFLPNAYVMVASALDGTDLIQWYAEFPRLLAPLALVTATLGWWMGSRSKRLS